MRSGSAIKKERAVRTKFIRTKILTGRPAQARYLALLVASMAIPLLLVGGCLYYLIFTLVAEQLGIPESIAYNLFPVIKKINLMLAVSLPPLFFLLILWGAVLSHRFAGPIERLEKEIDKITKSGDCSRRLRVRKHDEIKPIADAVNNLLDCVEQKGGR